MPSRTTHYVQPATTLTKTRSLRQLEYYNQQDEMTGSSSFYHDPSLGSSYSSSPQNGSLYLAGCLSGSSRYASAPSSQYCHDGTYATDDQATGDRTSQELPGTSYHAEENSRISTQVEPITIQVAAPFSPCSEPPQHTWRQQNDVTPSRLLSRYIQEVCHDGVLSYFCSWNECRHPVGFTQRSQVITHIRSIHLREKPFVCLTCNTRFGRKQEAKRHAITMNNGKQYRCSICRKAFSRKHYRDSHEERCLFDALSSGREVAGDSPYATEQPR